MTQTYDRPTLKDGHVTLRPPKDTDAASRFKLGNTAEIHHMFGADPSQVAAITKARATAWLYAQQTEPLAWVIQYRRRMIGAVRLHSMDHHDMRASLAIGILDPKLLGKGIGTTAMKLVARHAFGSLKLHRLVLRVVDYNVRAIAAYKKVGFVIEGVEREAARVADHWHDDVIMGLLATDFYKVEGA